MLYAIFLHHLVLLLVVLLDLGHDGSELGEVVMGRVPERAVLLEFPKNVGAGGPEVGLRLIAFDP